MVIATGAAYRRLAIPELERFEGSSIFYTTFGETHLVRDLNLAVTGGGNSAGQAAVHLASYARRVTMIVRANSLEEGMSDYLVRQIRAKPNIELRLGSEVVGGEGGERLERLAIRDNARNVVESVPVELLFVLIGATPHTDWLAGVVQRDAKDSSAPATMSS